MYPLRVIGNYTKKFDRRERPTVPDIRKFIAKIHETGFTVNAPRHKCAPTARTPKNIEAVFESVHENPSTSTRHHSHEFNIARISLR